MKVNRIPKKREEEEEKENWKKSGAIWVHIFSKAEATIVRPL